MTALTLGLIVYNLGHILTYICEGKDEIAVVRLNNELVVKITAEKCWENERAIFYEVADRSKTVIPTTYLSSVEPEAMRHFRLKAVSNEDGTVYGVVEQELPQKVWLLYSVNGDTWPRCERGGYDFCEERGEALLRELQKAHPEITFTF